MTKSPAAEVAGKGEDYKDPLDGLIPGRIVHYHPEPYQTRYSSPGPWPAIVTLVGEGGKVTLNVQLPTPTPIGSDPVARMENVPYSATKFIGCWSWPR